MKYAHTMTVIGRGTFPIDMLRYDACYPDTSADSGMIEASLEFDPHLPPREITIRKVTNTKDDQFTAKRWNSFGWACSLVETRKL